jgi:hypothetical protein
VKDLSARISYHLFLEVEPNDHFHRIIHGVDDVLSTRSTGNGITDIQTCESITSFQ